MADPFSKSAAYPNLNFPSDDYPATVYFMSTVAKGNTTFASQSCAANVLRLMPFRCNYTHTFDRLAFVNASSVNTFKFRLGIYADSARKPTGAPLAATAEITVADTNTATLRESTISQQLIAGTTYWLGILNDNTSTIMGISTTLNMDLLLDSGVDVGPLASVTYTPSLSAYTMAQAYGALPTIGTITQMTTSLPCPILMLRA